MAFHFSKKPIPIPRIYGLDHATFSRCYRNQSPVIIPDVVSTWTPITKWTPEYLTDRLKTSYENKLQVFVSKDNKHFINHPDVTELVTMSAEEFSSHVFQEPLSDDDGQTRYYLRTFSMPDTLFRDIDTNKQVGSLLGFLISEEDHETEECESKLCLQGIENTDRNVADKLVANGNGIDINMNVEKARVEEDDVWEDFLSPDGFNDETDSGDRGEHHGGEKLPSLKAEAQNDAVATEGGEGDYETQRVKTKEMHSRIFNSQTMQLWIGTRGNVTPLHYDRNHGLLAQFSGRKELVLFSHEDTPFLYPHPTYSDRAHTSRVDLRRMKDGNYANVFSKVQEAQPYTCILNPGELLYMPPFWWHDVTSLDNCVSVTLPWDIERYEEVPPCMMR